jgi:hypothetical protein
MEIHLANYKQDIIHNVTVNDKVVPFTLESYMHVTKLPKRRLYLATKDTGNQKHVNELPNVLLIDDEDDDDVFSLPYFNRQETKNLKAEQHKDYEASLQIHRDKSEGKKSSFWVK